MPPRIAVIDDLAPAREMLERSLSRSFEVIGYDSVTAAMDAFDAAPPEVIVTDLRMPGIDGLEGLRQFREKAPEIPVIIVTAYATVESAVQAMRSGAFDYLHKPFDPEELELIVARAAEHGQLRQENVRLRKELEGAWGKAGIVGRSPAMRDVVGVVERVAPTDVPVLIEGESGTGKDLVARAIHAMSHRAKGPFVALNVTAIPETLAESELFGHEKGAFSGAVASRAGFFEEANGGTIFLDEISVLPATLQPKLLRVLQNGEYIRVGSRQVNRADVRLLCASNEDLKKAVAEGRFREDLYYRINVVPVRLPALRERREDIPSLVTHFLTKHAPALGRGEQRFDADAMRLLLEYGWPGNVRELENVVERAMLMARGEVIGVDDLPEGVRAGATNSTGGIRGYREAREDWEVRYLQEVLRMAEGSVARAAELSGLHRSTFYEKLARHDLHVEHDGD